MCAAVNSSPPPQVTLSHSEQKSEKEIVQIPGRTKQKLAKKFFVLLYFFRNNVTNDGFRVLKFLAFLNESKGKNSLSDYVHILLHYFESFFSTLCVVNSS